MRRGNHCRIRRTAANAAVASAAARTRATPVSPPLRARSSASVPPARLHLFVCYYRSPSAARNVELDAVLRHNVRRDAGYDEVHVVVEPKDLDALEALIRDVRSGGATGPHTTPPPTMVHVHVYATRPHFCTMFAYAQRARDAHLSGGGTGSVAQRWRRRVVSVVTNSDIYVDSAALRTLRTTPRLADDRAAFALSRYDALGMGAEHERAARMFDRPDTQDCWVFGGTLPGSANYAVRCAPDTARIGDYAMGVWGCDNRLAYELAVLGDYALSNPARTLRTYHVHNAGGADASGTSTDAPATTTSTTTRTLSTGYRPRRATLLPPYLLLPPAPLDARHDTTTLWALSVPAPPTEPGGAPRIATLRLAAPRGDVARGAMLKWGRPLYEPPRAMTIAPTTATTTTATTTTTTTTQPALSASNDDT